MPDNFLGLKWTAVRMTMVLTSDIITKAQNLGAGDYFTISFCSKHTECAYLCILKRFDYYGFINGCKVLTGGHMLRHKSV